jgi:hypothetical protein
MAQFRPRATLDSVKLQDNLFAISIFLAKLFNILRRNLNKSATLLFAGILVVIIAAGVTSANLKNLSAGVATSGTTNGNSSTTASLSNSTSTTLTSTTTDSTIYSSTIISSHSTTSATKDHKSSTSTESSSSSTTKTKITTSSDTTTTNSSTSTSDTTSATTTANSSVLAMIGAKMYFPYTAQSVSSYLSFLPVLLALIAGLSKVRILKYFYTLFLQLI